MHSQNSPRYYTVPEYQFHMADSAPITFVADAEEYGSREFVAHGPDHIGFSAENMPTHTQYQPNVLYTMPAQNHPHYHPVTTIPVYRDPIHHLVPAPTTEWDYRYQQAAFYPDLQHPVRVPQIAAAISDSDQVARPGTMLDLGSLVTQPTTMPRSNSMSSASTYSSTQSSPLFPKQDWNFREQALANSSCTLVEELPQAESSTQRHAPHESQQRKPSDQRRRRSGKLATQKGPGKKGGRAVCVICEKDYGRPADCTRHIQTVHKGAAFPCKWCRKVLTRSDILLRHKNQNCIEMKKFANKSLPQTFDLPVRNLDASSSNLPEKQG